MTTVTFLEERHAREKYKLMMNVGDNEITMQMRPPR